MHCPKCGQQQASEQTRFCSRCGLLLTEIVTVVRNEGVIPGRAQTKSSARTRGLKQGLFLLLSALLIVPIGAMITIATNSEPFVVAGLFFLTVVGGVLRMAYALLFESGESGSATLEQNLTEKVLKRKQQKPGLKAAPVSTEFYSSPQPSKWMDTNELATPSSVTDNTTNLLQKDDQ
ncbi:MAG TPA: hypothetical protein VJ781_03330 [Pyrinomonadaceae bacterium]|nr:hypothetical protein [Pyrinomonadaceae bacterium]